MQRIIAVVIVLAAVGIVSAFAAGQLVPSHNAGAAPTAQQVREQNLDGSGLIRVHEQGTANVNVTNGSLPVSGTVNVGNFPSAAQGRLIGLGSQTLTPGANQHAYYQSAFVNVSDCRAITAMAVATGSGDAVAGAAVSFEASPEGTQTIPVIITGATNAKGPTENGAFAASVHDALISLPFVRMLVDAQANSPLTTSITVTAWIWCQP